MTVRSFIFFQYNVIQLVAILLCITFVSGCERKNDQIALYTQEYEFRYTLPAGLNNFETHVFPFERKPTLRDEIFNLIKKEDVQSIKISNARLRTTQNTSLSEIQKVELWLEKFEDPDREFFDGAYTFDLNPRETRQFIQLIPSTQDMDRIFDEEYFNLYLRHYLYAIPSQSYRMILTVEVSFYR